MRTLYVWLDGERYAVLTGPFDHVDLAELLQVLWPDSWSSCSNSKPKTGYCAEVVDLTITPERG